MEQDMETRRQELHRSGQAYCPECLSISVAEDNSFRFGRRYARVRSWTALLIELGGRVASRAKLRKYGPRCVCLRCGNQWYVKQAALLERHRERVHTFLEGRSAVKYPGQDGKVWQITEQSLHIFLSGEELTLPYDRLAAVDHRACNGPMYGRLTVWDEAHRRRRVPVNMEAAKKDRFTVLYTWDYKDAYRQLYSLLAAIAQENQGR